MWKEDFQEIKKYCKYCDNYFSALYFKVGLQTSSRCKTCRSAYRKELRIKFREANPRKKRITSDAINGNMFQCFDCKKWKNLECKSNQGYVCKPCRAEKANIDRRALGIKKKNLSKLIGNKKLCTNCNKLKTISSFSKNKRGLGGVGSYCKDCLPIVSAKGRDKEKSRRAMAKWRSENREKHLTQHRIRMYERNSGIKVVDDGTVTQLVKEKLYNTKVCFYCDKNILKENRTLDHKIPLSRKGKHSAANLVMSCFTCNSAKGAKTNKEFMLYELYKMLTTGKSYIF